MHDLKKYVMILILTYAHESKPCKNKVVGFADICTIPQSSNKFDDSSLYQREPLP